MNHANIIFIARCGRNVFLPAHRCYLENEIPSTIPLCRIYKTFPIVCFHQYSRVMYSQVTLAVTQTLLFSPPPRNKNYIVFSFHGNIMHVKFELEVFRSASGMPVAQQQK